jgi:hypothetical protein
MRILDRIKNWLFPSAWDSREYLPSDPNDVAELVKMQMGYTRGGIYAGITFIPKDSGKPWEEGEDCISSCPACGGVLRSIYQTSNEEQDGEFIVYYKTMCKDCNLLYDTGRKMTKREARASIRIYCDKAGGETFNRTGTHCAFVWRSGDMIDVCQRMETCEECPHPH